jgi:hypothetical protein
MIKIKEIINNYKNIILNEGELITLCQDGLLIETHNLSYCTSLDDTLRGFEIQCRIFFEKLNLTNKSRITIVQEPAIFTKSNSGGDYGKMYCILMKIYVDYGK